MKIITIQKTREMLNLSEEDYSDEEVKIIIGTTQVLARIFIDDYMLKKHKIKVPPRVVRNIKKRRKVVKNRKARK